MASKIFSLITCTCLLLLPFFSLAALASSNLQTPSPFEFLSKLQGLKKGDKAKEIPQLREYLNQFGYLSNNNKTQDSNLFDDRISLAIKTYQTFYNLEPTGILDVETVTAMADPRCGMADLEIQYQTIGNNNNTNLEYAFFPNEPKWPTSTFSLTYAFPPEVISSRRYVIAPVASAFEKWRQVVPQFTFTLIKDFNSADIKISFQKRAHGDGRPFDGPGGVLAHAFAPEDGRFHFDGDENWVVGAVAGRYDVETIALHEIGHLLGLAHSHIKEAIMFPKFHIGVTKGMSDDDRKGIRALYGS